MSKRKFSSIETMKRMAFMCVLLVDIFASCMSPELPIESEKRTLAFSVDVDNFIPTGCGTRAVAMSAAEKEIHTLYVVQFDGTGSTSQVVASGFAKFSGGHYVFDFQILNNVCTLYFIANIPSVAIPRGTLMNVFSQGEVPLSACVFQGMPLTGIPMFCSSNINLSIHAPTFSVKLKPLVARLTLNCDINVAALNLVGGQPPNLTLEGYLASRYFERPPGDTSPWFPAGATNRTINIGKSNTINDTFYVVENMAGETSFYGGWMWRPNYAPAGAMCIRINCPTTGGDIYDIYFYIGDQRYVRDFNIRRGHTYDVAISVQKLEPDDPRVKRVP